VVVSVADTGPGIAQEERAKVFQPFQQLDPSLRRRHGGSGLGLSISKHFVELHGGKMWFESQEGTGTTFFFRLPINPPPPPADDLTRWLSPEWHYRERGRPSLAPAPSVRPRFVVLEAGNVLQRLLNRYFDSAELVPVSTLDEAIAELSRTPARALLVNDVAAGEARQRLNLSAGLPHGTPAIVCSVPGTHEAAGTLGVSDYLVKPVAREALLAALDRLPLKGRTVLVADDEPEALRLFWRMLASSPRGYRVVAAGDGQRALRMLRELRPAVLLLDLVMPGMDGFQLLAAKRDDPTIRDIPVIVLSARDPAGQPIVASALAATRAGGLSVAQLLAAIRSLTGILATAGQAGDPAPQAVHPG
jgi:CheY-like chemotaxis protein